MGLGCPLAWAADAPTLEERAAAIERAAQERDGNRVVVGHLSRTLGIEVETLRAERARTGLGWGEILVVHRLSRGTRLTFEQVVAEFEGGKTWEQIARDHGVDLAQLANDVAQSQEVVEDRNEDHGLRGDTGTTPGRPGRAGGQQSGGGRGTGRGRY